MRNILITISFLTMLAMTDVAVCQENSSLSLPIGAEVPVWQWRCDQGETSLNFNPATLIDSSHTLVFDSIPYALDYTMVVVYKPIVATEAKIWRLDYDTMSSRSLTTEHIHSDKITIRYTDTTTDIPVINTLCQSAPDSTAPYVKLTLGGDSLGGSVKVAEVFYFNQRLNNAMLRRVQSALAIRYGITLGPVNYVDGEGDIIWHYADSGQYHHRVTGLGVDSTYGVRQLRSLSEMGGSLLMLSTDSLAEGEFLICGDNDAPLAFESDGDIDVLARRWRVNRTQNDTYVHLTFDTRTFAGIDDSLVLLVDGFSVRPDTITSDAVTYRYVMFPSDTSTFTLAKGSVFWHTEMCNGSSKRRVGNVAGAAVSSIYPNPTTGSYTIEVMGASQVKVSIYNAQGVLMDSFVDSDRWQYLFKGSLPRGNSYYATVTTESGTQTMKLIVE